MSFELISPQDPADKGVFPRSCTPRNGSPAFPLRRPGNGYDNQICLPAVSSPSIRVGIPAVFALTHLVNPVTITKRYPPKQKLPPVSWSAHTAIRSRREALGLSQTDLANILGVTKSLLSRIEAGKRQLTEAQVTTLSEILQIPPDLLLLGSGHLPDDVRGALAANAAEFVAAVRQRTEAQPVAYASAPRVVALPKTTRPLKRQSRCRSDSTLARLRRPIGRIATIQRSRRKRSGLSSRRSRGPAKQSPIHSAARA